MSGYLLFRATDKTKTKEAKIIHSEGVDHWSDALREG